MRLPRFSRAALLAKACKHHNQWQQRKAEGLNDLYAEVQRVSPQAPERILAKVCVNYLRYFCEQQAPELAALRGQPEHFARYSQFKHQVLQQIASTYDWLATECERQDNL